MKVIIKNKTAKEEHKEEGANITKSLSSFDVLQKKSRNRRVAFSKGRGIYTSKDGHKEVKVGEAPKKVKISKTSYKI